MKLNNIVTKAARTLVIILFCAVFAVALTGCGGGSSTIPESESVVEPVPVYVRGIMYGSEERRVSLTMNIREQYVSCETIESERLNQYVYENDDDFWVELDIAIDECLWNTYYIEMIK